MSGVCGIVHLDGAPVERRLLERMTAFMAFRGPDAQETWCDGAAGLGHTLLRTTFESEHEHQPSSLDGRTWITADARVDARDELRNKLAAKGRAVPADSTDDMLILHAWHAWGEDCVRHLLGDFAFAIWDATAKRLFCARDHFGAKPFFFARAGQRFIFSNTLDCLREHPGIDSELDDLAIADFLLFEMSQDPAATVFAGIRRLPPGQCLTCTPDGVKTRTYWTLPIKEPVRYRARGDYVEHFKELLETAVSDRLRTDRIGIQFTGGMDSTSIGATAKRILSRQSKPFSINAQTFVYDRLIPDQERRFAAMAAERLGIPIRFFVVDDYGLGDRRYEGVYRLPEPTHDLSVAKSLDGYRQASSYCRVVLTGWDGDALLNESPKPYLRTLLKQRRLARAIWGALGYGISQRRLIPLSLRKRAAARGPDQTPGFPRWIDRSLEARLDLRARWERFHAQPETSHPVRPYAFRTLGLIRKSNFFECGDAGVTRLPLEHRHPLLDLRLVEYCLTLPPLPWCVKKKILREAMRGVLPEAVRLRPKSPLGGWPEMEQLRQPDARWVDEFVPVPQLGRYVDRSRIPPVRAAVDPEDAWNNLRPLSLNLWLDALQPERPQ